ncbi:hypothetical protein F4777DRAFT_582556 [Nemania sp. FL0916]|nr:hypothetical protein F4777DRAFT_582556 [Nemania sp. FL0916]
MATQHAEFQSKLESIRSYITQIQSHIDNDLNRNTATISDRLQFTLGTLFKLAIFVRGNYDGRPDDMKQKTELLNELTRGCDAVHKITLGCLTELGNRHTETVEFRATQVVPLSENIDRFIEEVRAKIESSDQQIQTVRGTIQREQGVLENETKSLQKLSQDLQSAKMGREVVDIGLSILFPIWGIINLIDHSKGPGSVALGNTVDHTRRAVEIARNTLESTHRTLRELRLKHYELLDVEHTQTAIALELPGQAALVNAAIQSMGEIEGRLITTEGAATQAARWAAKLSNAALVTSHLVISKREFVEGILDVLEALVMDRKSASVAKQIVEELINKYNGKGMKKELQDRCTALKGNIGRYLPKPSAGKSEPSVSALSHRVG